MEAVPQTEETTHFCMNGTVTTVQQSSKKTKLDPFFRMNVSFNSNCTVRNHATTSEQD